MKLSNFSEITVRAAFEELTPKARIEIEQILDRLGSPEIKLSEVAGFTGIPIQSIQLRLRTLPKPLVESLVVDPSPQGRAYQADDLLILVYWSLAKHQENIRTNKPGMYTLIPRKFND